MSKFLGQQQENIEFARRKGSKDKGPRRMRNAAMGAAKKAGAMTGVIRQKASNLKKGGLTGVASSAGKVAGNASYGAKKALNKVGSAANKAALAGATAAGKAAGNASFYAKNAKKKLGGALSGAISKLKRK